MNTGSASFSSSQSTVASGGAATSNSSGMALSSSSQSNAMNTGSASFSSSQSTVGGSSGVMCNSSGMALSSSSQSNAMNASSSSAVSHAAASSLSQGVSSRSTSSTIGTARADDQRFEWIKGRIVTSVSDRSIDSTIWRVQDRPVANLKSESEMAGDATVYPEPEVGYELFHRCLHTSTHLQACNCLYMCM